MFTLVQTPQQQEIFEKIYRQIASEKAFLIEEKGDNVVRYLFEKDGEYIGTIEFIPFNPEVFSTVETEQFSFLDIQEIRENRDTTWEIDKVGFLPEFRGRGYVDWVIDCIQHHYFIYKNTFNICLFDSKFYRLLRILYRKYPIEQLGEAFVVEGEIGKTIPSIVRVKEYNESLEKELKSPIKI